MERARRRLIICNGFPWKLPREALDAPRYGCVNQHPAKLPRHRGPIPLSWAFRDGDTEFWLTWHRMDAELDTGAILAQTSIPILDEETTMFETGPRLVEAELDLLPRVFERLAAGDPGEPQATEGGSWAGMLGEDYATIDWSQTAQEIHNQVRAWNYALGTGPLKGRSPKSMASASSSCARASPIQMMAPRPSTSAMERSGSSSPSRRAGERGS